MTNKEIRDIIKLELLHRYVFDKLYIQSHDIGKDDFDILTEYNLLYKKYPVFRQQCADIFIYFYQIDLASTKFDQQLDEDNVKLFIELSKINFNRYSIDDESKHMIKKIKNKSKKWVCE